MRFANGALGTVEASWVQTGGMSGFEITGSEGTIFKHPDKGMLVTAPGQDAAEVAPGEARPTTVDRLVAAIRGELSREELAADLQCAVNAVAVMDACYASDKSGAWENVVGV
ncbi:MAG: Gfo/Idh/MocA family oxidoreductase [Candidatus Latescibacterota bacterium]|nr:Gfo/Idh/MocA family oxidoreductase [Candidatus Latescibacterota bacterium]